MSAHDQFLSILQSNVSLKWFIEWLPMVYSFEKRLVMNTFWDTASVSVKIVPNEVKTPIFFSVRVRVDKEFLYYSGTMYIYTHVGKYNTYVKKYSR